MEEIFVIKSMINNTYFTGDTCSNRKYSWSANLGDAAEYTSQKDAIDFVKENLYTFEYIYFKIEQIFRVREGN